MLLDVSKIQNKELADYLFTLLRCSSEKGIPDAYTQKAKTFGHMFDEKFAESLPKCAEKGILTVEVHDSVCGFGSSGTLETIASEKVASLKIEAFTVHTHYGRIAWIAYFLDTPDSACISPFSEKENPSVNIEPFVSKYLSLIGEDNESN